MLLQLTTCSYLFSFGPCASCTAGAANHTRSDYVTVGHSQRWPINVPNENLDVQYTGVKFDTEAPAV